MLGVVFDLDGTLVDSLDGICVAAAHAVKHVGRPVPSREAVSTYIGTGVKSLLHRSLTGDFDGVAEDDIFQDAFKVFTDHYYESCIHGTSLRKHAREVIDRLRVEGRSLAVLTNKPSRPTHRILNHLGLLQQFDLVMSPEEVGVRKPDPRGMEMAIEAFDVDAVVMVGDSVVDLDTAIAADAPFVGIQGGYHVGKSLEDVVSSPHLMIEELEGLPGAIQIIESSRYA